MRLPDSQVASSRIMLFVPLLLAITSAMSLESALALLPRAMLLVPLLAEMRAAVMVPLPPMILFVFLLF